MMVDSAAAVVESVVTDGLMHYGCKLFVVSLSCMLLTGLLGKIFRASKPMFREIEGGRRLELKYIN